MAYKNDSILRLASEHLEYELKMLNSLKKVNLKVKKPKIRNSRLEAFLVHARNLCEFLYSPPKRKDTVLASHFFDNLNYWAKNGHKKSVFLKRNVEDMHKYLSHITYTRIQRIKLWDLDKIASEINSAFDAFLRLVPEHRMCKKLVNRKKRLSQQSVRKKSTKLATVQGGLTTFVYSTEPSAKSKSSGYMRN